MASPGEYTTFDNSRVNFSLVLVKVDTSTEAITSMKVMRAPDVAVGTIL